MVGKASDVLVFAEVMHQGTGSKVTGFLQSLVCLDNRTRTEILQKKKRKMKKAFKFSLERGSEGTREAGSGSVRFTSLWPGFDSGVRLKPSFLVGLVPL